MDLIGRSLKWTQTYQVKYSHLHISHFNFSLFGRRFSFCCWIFADVVLLNLSVKTFLSVFKLDGEVEVKGDDVTVKSLQVVVSS